MCLTEMYAEKMMKDFLSEYNKTIQSHGAGARRMKRKRLVNETLLRGAPRFYVSDEVAARTISLMLRGECINIKRPIRRQMYEDIFKGFTEWKKDNPYGTLMEGISHVVNNKAPRFYVSLEHAINRFK